MDELTLVADIARLKLAVAHLGTSTDNIRDIISRLDRSDAINSEKIRYLEQTAQAVKDDISKLDTSLQAIQYKLAEVRGLVDSDKVEVTLGDVNVNQDQSNNQNSSAGSSHTKTILMGLLAIIVIAVLVSLFNLEVVTDWFTIRDAD